MQGKLSAAEIEVKISEQDFQSSDLTARIPLGLPSASFHIRSTLVHPKIASKAKHDLLHGEWLTLSVVPTMAYQN